MVRPAFLTDVATIRLAAIHLATIHLAGIGLLFTPVTLQAGGDLTHRPLPPPEVAYRDPTYLPPPPVPVPARRSLNRPLYNEPPPRF